jgi:hypothetical protein
MSSLLDALLLEPTPLTTPTRPSFFQIVSTVSPNAVVILNSLSLSSRAHLDPHRLLST